ncbi:MAG: hypothetical protein KBA75_00070 [Alphaproteobacteria bacterium]|nr:hypothetical protein [Alphaproteobacteria bacterium]
MAIWLLGGISKVVLATLAIILLCLLGINTAMPYLVSHPPFVCKAGWLITLMGMLILFMFIGLTFSYWH